MKLLSSAAPTALRSYEGLKQLGVSTSLIVSPHLFKLRVTDLAVVRHREHVRDPGRAPAALGKTTAARLPVRSSSAMLEVCRLLYNQDGSLGRAHREA